MQVTLDIPDAVASQLAADGQDPARAALEAIAVEAYRTQRASASQVRRMLGFTTRIQVHALLAAHDVPLHYTEEMLRQDIENSERLFAERSAADAA